MYLVLIRNDILNTGCQMPKSQQSWVRSQHPLIQWNLRMADEAVLNKVHKNTQKIKKSPITSLLVHFYNNTDWCNKLFNVNDVYFLYH
jgi:hypothetical protein